MRRIRNIAQDAQKAIGKLLEYLEVAEAQLEEVKRKEREEISTFYEGAEYDADEKHFLVESEIDELRERHDAFFANYFRYSFVVLVYLVLEDKLDEVCKVLEAMQSAGYDKPKYDVMRQYKDWLIKLGINMDDKFWNGEHWMAAHDLSKVRNCIVHASGQVRLSKDEIHLRQLAAKGNGLSISRVKAGTHLNALYETEDRLIVEPMYCRKVVMDVQKLFGQLYEHLPKDVLITYFFR